ncbi:hypothetical protein SALBM311S_11828 [Streptomyces alboniger]
MASRRPVPSALFREGFAATVTTTANLSLSSDASFRTEGSASTPCPIDPCSTAPSAAVPTCISQRCP